MNRDQQREETLFAAALAKPLAERAAFLDGACHGDAALRTRLEALLAEHEQSDELTPVVGPSGTLKIRHTTVLSAVTEQAGDRPQLLKFFLPLFGFSEKEINFGICSALCHSIEAIWFVERFLAGSGSCKYRTHFDC